MDSADNLVLMAYQVYQEEATQKMNLGKFAPPSFEVSFKDGHDRSNIHLEEGSIPPEFGTKMKIFRSTTRPNREI